MIYLFLSLLATTLLYHLDFITNDSCFRLSGYIQLVFPAKCVDCGSIKFPSWLFMNITRGSAEGSSSNVNVFVAKCGQVSKQLFMTRNGPMYYYVAVEELLYYKALEARQKEEGREEQEP